jgi:hypothetical protein
MNEMNYMAGNQETGNVGAYAAQAVMAAGQAVQPFPATAESVPIATPQEAKPYTLRDLCAKDIFPMTKIIRKIGLKDIGQCFDPEEIKAITGSLSESENGEEKSVDEIAETVGISVVLKIVDVVLENLSAAEQEIFGFLAGIAGMTADDVACLPMDVFFEMLVDIFKKKEFVGFMKVVSKLLK